MKTDIIVPVFNGLSDAVEMYESLKATTSDFRLIIVDNGSTDGVGEFFESRGEEVIRLPKNLGFGAAINRGIERIKSENVVFLNSDVVLSDGWLTRLLQKKNAFPAPIGMIGPVTNFGIDTQVVPWEAGSMSKGNIQAQAKVISEKNKGHILEVSMLSFFCCLLDARMIQSLGPLEEWFPGGFEDNDYAIRAWEAGWRLMLAPDIFVFHKGSQTLTREFGDAAKVFDARLDFLKKHFENQEQPKIVALYRVKNDRESFKKSLESTSKLVDAIYVWDDNSDLPLRDLVESFPKVERYYESHLPFDEYRDRSVLLSWAKASEYNWALVLDSDESLEPGLTYESLHELVKVPDPIIRSFIFHENTFWFPGFFRNDGIWSGQAHDRLFKLSMNQELRRGTSKGFHCSTTPVFPPESRRLTSLRIMHYGYLDPERRAEKYRFYTEQDTDKIPELIGGEDYSHLKDNGFLRVCKFDPENHASLNVLLRPGEEIDTAAILIELWGSVREINLLVEEENEHSNLLKEIFRANVYVDSEGMDLSTKRNYLIERARQRWALFLDSDEKLEQPGFLRAMMDADPDGYMFWVKNLMKDRRFTISENVRFFRNDRGFLFSGKIHETIEETMVKGKKIVNSPTPILHMGYLKPDGFLEQKLQNYYQLLLEELEARPNDAKVHFSLALHYFNEENEEDGLKHLQKAIDLNPKFAEAKKELAHFYIGKSHKLLSETVPILPNSHPLKPKLAQMEGALEQMIEKPIRLGKNHAQGS